MNGEIGEPKKPDDVEDDIESSEPVEDTVVLDATAYDDNVGDISVEIDVTALVEKIESTDGDVEKREVRRRLEKLREQKEAEKDIDSTYNFNLEDDL